MIVPAVLALSALLAAPSGEPLDADVFDASAPPTVIFDVVTPASQASTMYRRRCLSGWRSTA